MFLGFIVSKTYSKLTNLNGRKSKLLIFFFFVQPSAVYNAISDVFKKVNSSITAGD